MQPSCWQRPILPLPVTDWGTEIFLMSYGASNRK